METSFYLMLVIICLLPQLLVFYNFYSWFFRDRIDTWRWLWMAVQIWVVVVLPSWFLYESDIFLGLDCCKASAVFSPGHKLGVYAVIIIGMISYFASRFRRGIWPPLAELFLNLGLILGVMMNVLLFVHLHVEVDEPLPYLTSLVGNLPIILLFLIALSRNHDLMVVHLQEGEFQKGGGVLTRICWRILSMRSIYKFPVLVLLCLPVLVILSLILLLFGQKPDSMIRAFTDTYKYGFSQLDSQCDNVDCGGHYLCSVGANGHRSIVKPVRYGKRAGGRIICNRQLLIANAFEELIQERMPNSHRMIRRGYDRIGDMVHRYYGLFRIKWVSDLTYLLMKPLELFFLACLYAFDRKPENRIAVQYLDRADRLRIKEAIAQVRT